MRGAWILWFWFWFWFWLPALSFGATPSGLKLAPPVAGLGRAARFEQAKHAAQDGSVAAAETVLEKLLCECPDDPLSVRIATELAVILKSRGEGARAYWVLAPVPSDLVRRLDLGAQKEFLDLLLESADSLEDPVEATAAYGIAFATVQRIELRANYLARFKKKLAAFAGDGDWAALIERVRDSNLWELVLAQMPADAPTTFENDPKNRERPTVEGLHLAPVAAREITYADGTKGTRLEVAGRYRPDSERTLRCGGAPIPLTPGGRFRLELEVIRGTASLYTTADHPAQRTQYQADRFPVPDAAHYRAAAPDPDLLKVEKLTPARRSRWRVFSFSAALRYGAYSHGMSSLLPLGAWTPRYRFSRSFELGANLGIGGSAYIGQNWTWLVDARAIAAQRFTGGWRAEVGIGVQDALITSQLGFALSGGVGLEYHAGEGIPIPWPGLTVIQVFGAAPSTAVELSGRFDF